MSDESKPRLRPLWRRSRVENFEPPQLGNGERYGFDT